MVNSFIRIKFRVLKSTALSCAALLLSSCGMMGGTITTLFGSGADDFARSAIISSGQGIADGQSELLLVVRLVNSDGSKVKSYTPLYQLISGVGVTASACTPSNTDGVSTCVLKAIQAGVKRVSFTNIKIQLEGDVVFNNPTAKPIVGLISAQKQQTSGTYTLSATVGNQEPGVVKASGTYKLYGGVQGEAFSR